MSLIDLKCYDEKLIEETEHDIHMLLTIKFSTKYCMFCNSDKLQAFGKRTLHFMDLPIRGKRVGLETIVQRYRCKECSRITQTHVYDMSEKYRMTKRLEEYIRRNSVLKPFTKLAEEIGVSEGNIRKIFNDYVTELGKNYVFETPRVMGIDEIYLAKQPRCVITNIEQRTIIEMLKDRNKPTVIKYLSHVKDPHVILNVTMDMWKPYKDAVQDTIKHAIIVIDKFHVVRMANNGVEKCRKELRVSLPVAQRRDLKNDRFILLKRENELHPRQQLLLSHWRLNYPLLGKVYELKEAFYTIYDAPTKEEAYKRYEHWESSLENDVLPYFAELQRAVSNWHKEIFSYFDYKVTNAYTESLNSVIRHIDRMGRSYGFESIRAKILYASNIHNKGFKPKFQRRNYGMDKMSKDILYQEALVNMEEVNYGVSIEKLAKILESGKLQFNI